MIGNGDCGEIGGINIGRKNVPQRHFVHHNPTWLKTVFVWVLKTKSIKLTTEQVTLVFLLTRRHQYVDMEASTGN
jgi:hypothetical protein